MANFRVGQRARIVRGCRHPENEGRTCKVVASIFHPAGTPTLSGFDLRHDTDLMIAFDEEDGDWAVASWQLEPIVDDGRKVMGWDALNELGLSADKLLGVVKERVKEKA